MADIFHEVDEEVRRERVRQIWARYGNYLVALAVLVVVGIGGWRGYDYYQNQKAAQSGAAFEQAVTLAEDNKPAEAEAAFNKLAVEGTPGYQALARFRAAAALGQRDPAAAVRAYDELSATSANGPALQDLASLRAGYLLVDSAPLDEMRRRLEPLSAAGRPFRHSAREILALAAWRSGDIDAARRYVDMITTDAETPQGTRQRVDVLAALLASAGKS